MPVSKPEISLAFIFIILVITVIVFIPFSKTNETMPDDIRYMLEDMYGADKNEWPSPRYKEDLNNDGFHDWIAKNKNCESGKPCSAEIFICIPDKKGKCSEYCYIEVKTLENIEEKLPDMKCESTC